ncbi:MAG: VCBS repeat-containing protein [Candidatus Midichloria sp.]|nr:VCBS repeat-containing protein [Candidatus Midichloria sp.]
MADFNDDGKTDIANCNQGVNAISLLLGNGDGTFRLQYISGSANISVLLNNGGGAFQPVKNFGTSGGSTGVKTTDFNGDGKTDIVSTDVRAVSVVLGNGDSTFQAAKLYGAGGHRVTVADFKWRCKQDIVQASMSLSAVNISQLTVNYGVASQPHPRV